MWSNIIKPDEEVIKESIVQEDALTTIPVVTGDQLRFKRKIKAFIEKHKDSLDKLYNKHFKDYEHISKKDFYIFAYARTKYE